VTRPIPCPPRGHTRRGSVLPTAGALAAFLLLAVPARTSGQSRSCERCHGELELLRQHVPTLEDARARLVLPDVLGASAHGGMPCTRCHEGFGTFPHDTTAVTTTTCASCHKAEAATWATGVHALDTGAQCADCHGVHDVRTRRAMETLEGARALRQACTKCHFDAAMPDTDPHADSVSCAGCHEPHGTLSPQDERSQVNVLHQAQTCGACHAKEAAAWKADVHGGAVPALALPGGRVPAGASRAEPPSCTACHGAHGMLTPSTPGFQGQMVQRCAHCHAPYAESFADSYHGQATALGSETVATCHDCHSSHGIYPAADPRSTVSDGRRLATCQHCHTQATAGFALFQPHADHKDRARYPYVYWSFHLMSALLIGTFTLFGVHTVLWLARLGIDALKGAPGHSDHAGD
jgi:Cytochrome c7 and related cytochrome c